MLDKRTLAFLFGTIAILLCLCGAPSVARAQAVPRQYIRFDLGLSSPVGFAGLSYGFRVVPAVALEGGAGIGHSGVQLSALAKVGRRFFLAVGASAGLRVAGIGYFNEQAPGVIYFANFELGWQHRWESGSVIQVAGGLSVVTPGSSHYGFGGLCGLGGEQCNEPPSDHAGSFWPIITVGFGRAL